jgi:hypothetical protein
MIRVFLLIAFLLPLQLFAKVAIPKNLTPDDQVRVLEILGPGTSSKILTDPYPLGGFAGFEVGIQMDSIPVGDLSNLGDTVSKQELFNYPIISIGKGVYKDVDFFIHFIPSSEGTGISEYGGIVRWGFYQMAYLPVSFAFNISADSANINNQLITKNFGYDLTAGITTQNIYFYSGIGQLQSGGRFSGGVEGVTLSNNTENHKITEMHYLAGVGFRVENIFLTTQMDYHVQPTYSLKVGFRY